MQISVFWTLDAGSAPALIEADGSVITSAALGELADKLAAELPIAQSGRSFGFLLLRPEGDHIARYLGCLRSGRHVPLLLNADMSLSALNRLLEHFGPDWVAGHPADWLPGKYRRVGDLLVSEALGDSPAPNAELGLLLATSGSTGAPKLVRLSYAALAANAKSIVEYLGLHSSDRAITTLPLAYSFGMSILNSHLAAGASLALSSMSMLDGRFWEMAREQGITSLSGVPSSYEIMRRARLDVRGLDRLRMLTQAGGKLSPALTRHFADLCRDKGWQFFVMYGQTEAAPRMSYLPPDRVHEKVGSIGIAVPNGSLSIDPATGELIYRGPNVMMGYAERREDLILGDEQRGVLRTGDLAEVDADGYFRITGRLKRFVKLSGTRISLDMVEAALGERVGCNVAATGTDDELQVWLPDRAGSSEAQTKTLLQELFGIFAGHVRVIRVEALPLQASGKLDYAALKA